MENITAPKMALRDLFYQLLSVVALYMSAVSFIVLVFELINDWFPDALYTNNYGSGDAIRWSASILIVMFPLYLWLMRMITKDTAANPAKREAWIRKLLGYITLFAAAITIIIDVITLIYNFLGGELSIRFFLKILVVLVVAGLIFFYYKKDLKMNQPSEGVQS